jgi:hypothetical protein
MSACAFVVDVPPKDALVLRLPRPGTLVLDSAWPHRDITVLDSTGAALGGLHDSTDERGRARLSLAPGRYAVALADGPRGEFEIREDDITLLRLR